MEVNTKKLGAPIQPTMYDIFFEGINFAAVGGLYAEIVKNRSELVILVTPHVISTPADGSEISRRVLERISKAPGVIAAEAAIDAKAESLGAKNTGTDSSVWQEPSSRLEQVGPSPSGSPQLDGGDVGVER